MKCRISCVLAVVASVTMVNSAHSTAALVYYGGPVLSNAQIVMVNWNSNVPAETQTGMPTFYGDIAQSDYWTVFLEYGTSIVAHDGSQGTNQQIGFGTFVRAFTIAPSKCSGTTACTLLDTDIDAELSSQIAASQLPPPTTDAAGNVNTVFMVHFPPNITISQRGADSCASGGFCATSSAFSYGGLSVPTGIIPDQGGACATGCGGGAGGYFQIETYTSIFVLADLVTDPLSADATVLDNPLAWYDPLNGDISIVCSAKPTDLATIVANGNTYNVAKLWSNHYNACMVSDGVHVVVKPSAGSDGKIIPGVPRAVAIGTTTTFTIAPDPGYAAIMGGTCGGSLAGTAYTTNAVTSDCTVTASFIDRIFADGFESP